MTWPNFLAWKVLRNTPKFRPPSPRTIQPVVAVAATASTQPAVAAVTAAAAQVSAAIATPTSSSFLTQSSSSFTEVLNGQEKETTCSGDARPITTNNDPPSSFTTQLPFLGNLPSTDAQQNSLLVPTPVVSSLLPFPSMDPSRGGRGASMGRNKAKRELEKEKHKFAKAEELKRIRLLIEEQTQQQVRTGKMMAMKQLLSVAIDPADDFMRKRVKEKMFQIFLDEENH
jgi:hypothetical protein